MRARYVPWLVTAMASGLSFWAGTHWGKDANGALREPPKAAIRQLPVDVGRVRIPQGPSASVALPATEEEEARSPVERLKAALAEQNSFRRMQIIYRGLASLTPGDAKEVLGVFQENERKGRKFVPEFAWFIRRWGEVDGAAALAFAVKTWPDKNQMSDLVTHMAGGWASQQPQQAVDWLNAHPNAEPWMQDAVMVGLVDGLAEKDIELARRFVEDRLDDPHSEQYLEQLTDRYIYSEGMEKAEAWFDSLSHEKLGLGKTRMLAQLADRHLRAGPEQAAAFLSRYAAEPWFGQVAAMQVAREYFRTDPVKAEAWVNTMPATMQKALRVRPAGNQ